MTKAKPGSIVLANWGRRFIAWLIDYVIINVMLAYFRVEDIESRFIPANILPRLPGFDISIWSPISVLIFFLYWTLSEWYFGRSIGQLLLNIRLADLQGRGASLAASAIQSVGKSFGATLLPLDCVIGWVYPPCRKNRQRFFNKLSNTIVIYIGTPMHAVKEGNYAKEA
jgi:uncharacterized RDD family membrane protein YckC